MHGAQRKNLILCEYFNFKERMVVLVILRYCLRPPLPHIELGNCSKKT